MKVQKYIDHLKSLGATFINMEADVVATLPTAQLMITCCRLDDNLKVIKGIDYKKLIGVIDTTPTVFLSDIKVNGVWVCIADSELGGFIELFELDN